MNPKANYFLAFRVPGKFFNVMDHVADGNEVIFLWRMAGWQTGEPVV